MITWMFCVSDSDVEAGVITRQHSALLLPARIRPSAAPFVKSGLAVAPLMLRLGFVYVVVV